MTTKSELVELRFAIIKRNVRTYPDIYSREKILLDKLYAMEKENRRLLKEITKIQKNIILKMVNKKDDRLKILFEIQKESQTKRCILGKISNSKILWQNYVNQMILACHEEITEIMRETCYKNPDYVEFGWKKQQTINLDKMKDEIIDLQHFVFNLSIAAGMEYDEFFQRYLNKNKTNLKRMKCGY